MRLILVKKDDELNAEYEELMGMLEEGKYLVTVRSLNGNKTERDFQNEYFALLDMVSGHTGEQKYIIHEEYKAHRKVETTKDFSLQDWVNFIDAFKWKQYTDLDMIL